MTEEEKLVGILKERGLIITTVESLTGGMIASTIVNVPGASDVFRRGYITYCDEAKHDLVGVSLRTLEKYTAVSAETAREMAEGGVRTAVCDAALSATGIAGPDGGTEEKPVGLVYIGFSIHNRTTVKKLLLDGSRLEIRQGTVREALRLAVRELSKENGSL
ncbi:MAG: CinA family protein [Lachnospiraceae bacterium]|jgi:PncC family amidohydrolase|nr:CinA family protein [Lachnospiraceae bacterium]MCI1327495.1 CinA family protein [Lachnospiraceae bacterium]